MTTGQFVNNELARRYELRVDSRLVGYIQYRTSPRRVVLTHTQVEAEESGHGYGAQLVRSALEDLRERNVPILVACPFIKSWLSTHRDFDDLDIQLAPNAPASHTANPRRRQRENP